MQKIVVNKCYGGFGLSSLAKEKYDKLTNSDVYDYQIPRDDPFLIIIVEELGDEANTRFSDLHITEIPDDAEWEIGEYDGQEWVAEKHRTW